MSNIKIKDLNFSYSKKPFLTDINLDIKSGNIYGLLGKNGAGKTTLLKLIAGLRFPQSGMVMIDGYSVKDRNPSFIQDVYYLAEELYLPSISSKQYVKIYSKFYPNFNVDEYHQYINEFKVPEANRLDKMSYGQKKKFLIAFGIAANTKLFIMDEPTNGLDIPSKSMYRKILSSTIKEDRAYIISTHQIKDIELMLDQVVILDEDRIKMDESMARISELFYFTQDDPQDEEATLYQEDQFLKVNRILSNPQGKDSMIDLELLFNAVVSNDPTITNQLKQA